MRLGRLGSLNLGRSIYASIFLIMVILMVSPPVRSEMGPASTGGNDPLAPFARLVGDEWHLDQTYQTFEWGMGRRSIIARGHVLANGEVRLVSEGLWFWHPGEKVIKGYLVARGMGIVLFEYTTRFEGDKMVGELKTFDAKGTEPIHREEWKFEGDDRYLWTLYQGAGGGPGERMMEGTHARQGKWRGAVLPASHPIFAEAWNCGILKTPL